MIRWHHMLRLVGITVLLWSVFASIEYSLANAPQVDASGSDRVVPATSPVEALSEATAGVLADDRSTTLAFTMAHGVYSVADSDDEKIAKADRDLRPRRAVFDDDGRPTDDSPLFERVNGELVGEIEAGLYSTAFETEGCSYQLWAVMRDRKVLAIGEEYLADGRLLVSVNAIEPDWFSASRRCGDWAEWVPPEEPLTNAANGDYWIGDLEMGLWEVPEGCHWEKVVAFRGGKLEDIVDSGGSGALLIDSETYGLRLRRCHSPIRLARPLDDLGHHASLAG